jgi:hypothetical protein
MEKEDTNIYDKDDENFVVQESDDRGAERRVGSRILPCLLVALR